MTAHRGGHETQAQPITATHSLATVTGSETGTWFSKCPCDPVRLLENSKVPYFAGNSGNKDVGPELQGASA